MYFAGIGSRAMPEELIPTVEFLTQELIQLGFILRSGGAAGADSFWENAYDKFGGQKEIFLPYKNFNDNPSPLFLKDVDEDSDEGLIAAKYHPKWNQLPEYAKRFHIRNTSQVLGSNVYDNRQWSEFIICWTPEAKMKGGTAQAMRIANGFMIPIFNLANEDETNKVDRYLKMNYSLWT